MGFLARDCDIRAIKRRLAEIAARDATSGADVIVLAVDVTQLLGAVEKLDAHNRELAAQLNKCIHNLNERDLKLQRIRLAVGPAEDGA
jgi:predicted dinucleotide-binding enzyme